MKNEKLFRIKDIVSIFIFVVSLLLSLLIVIGVLEENLGMGQVFLSFMFLIFVFLTLFFCIGLLRHFTGFVEKSWIFYIFQFLLAIIVSFLIVSMFTTQVVTHSQNKVLATIKSELSPMVADIEQYQKEHDKNPENIRSVTAMPLTLKNLYYFSAANNFILGTHIASLDIDGAQIFYDSRDKSWYQFHNDMYQHYKDKNDKPKSIEKYISFQKQKNVLNSSLRNISGSWLSSQDIQKKNSQDHLTQYKKSCMSGDGASCTAIGMRYGMGLEVKQSDTKAWEYFTKACELEDGNGCEYLVRMYERGNYVQKDTSKSVELYKKACKLGAKSACSSVK